MFISHGKHNFISCHILSFLEFANVIQCAQFSSIIVETLFLRTFIVPEGMTVGMHRHNVTTAWSECTVAMSQPLGRNAPSQCHNRLVGMRQPLGRNAPTAWSECANRLVGMRQPLGRNAPTAWSECHNRLVGMRQPLGRNAPLMVGMLH